VVGVVTNYHWDFGDGNSQDTGTTPTVSHTYGTSDTYFVILTVTTTTGAGSSSNCPVSVAGDGPPLVDSCIPTFGVGTGLPGSAFEIIGSPYAVIPASGPGGETTVFAEVPINVTVRCPDSCFSEGTDFYFQMGGSYTSCFDAVGPWSNSHLSLTV